MRAMQTAATACPQCRADAPAGARFCPQCGAALAAAAAAPAARPGERRPVAVLFADLSGYTALSSELDPEDVHRLLSRYFERVDGIVGQCGGTIDKHIGDAVMGVFGAPVAYGNDTLRALRAAAGIHAAMAALSAEFGRPLAAHVGVASGEVVAADTGSSIHRTYTVTGDAVNLAARLDEIARANETVISDDVYRACAAFVEADQAGAVPIRGLAHDVPVWKLRSLRTDVTADHPLIGREAELSRFVKLLERVADGDGGATLVVRADPGLGKTRLTQEFVVQARRRGFAAHAAAVLDFGTAQGRDALHTLFASLLAIAPDATDAERRAALDRAVAAGAVGVEHEPFAADLLVVPQVAAATYESMEDAARTEGRVRLLADAVERAAAARPVLLLVEDMHWATPRIAAGVHALADCAARAPVLLVCTTRREGDPFGAPPLAVACDRLDLPPLPARDALALAQSYLTANPDVAQRCVERAQGNPLFLTQLLRSGADGAAVPGTIQSVVLSRLDRLPAADKAAVQAAAVVGQRFDLPLLRHLLGDPAYDAGTLLGRDLVRVDEADARRFVFVHALIRDGAYASLLHSARRALHLRAADWYRTRDLVLHAEHLDRGEDPAAAAACLAAARAESAALRFDAALRLARRGGELPAAADVHHDLARLAGDIARNSGDAAGSLADFERALAHARDDAQRSAAYLGMAAAHRATGAATAGLAVLDVVEPLAVAAGLLREASRAAYLRGCLEFARGDARASEAAQERARVRAHAVDDAECEAQALSGLADVLYADGRMVSAYAAFERCVALCEREGFARFALNNRCMLAIVHSYLAPADAALPVLDGVRTAARELRQRAAEVMADETEAWVRVMQGRYREAIAPAERSLAHARAIVSRRFVLFNLGLLVYAYWNVGRRGEAREFLREAFVLADDVGSRFVGPLLHGARAMMVERAADLPAVLAEGERSLAPGCPAHCHFWFRRYAIDAALAHGDWACALAQADALADFARAEAVPWVDFTTAYARALAAAGQGRGDAAALAACRTSAVAMRLDGALPALDAALARL